MIVRNFMQFEVILALVVLLLPSFCVAETSNTAAKFHTGPFTVSVDPGAPCNNVTISKPISGELSGLNYTGYVISACGIISILRCDTPGIILNTNYTDITRSNLMGMGADEDTIIVFERKVNGKPGAFGSGYLPKYDARLYLADFAVSNWTMGHIIVWNNETLMISMLKTIHITEAGQ
jgi:hypothetical protein